MAGGPAREYNNRLIRWVEYRLPIFSAVEATIGRDMPTPKNLNYWWSLGSVLFLALIIQIATGIFLAMHYVPNGAMAFDSVEQIMRNVITAGCFGTFTRTARRSSLRPSTSTSFVACTTVLTRRHANCCGLSGS